MKLNTVAVAAGIVLVAAAGYLLWTVTHPAAPLVQGEVEATRIDLSAMVSARVSDTPVAVGDRVAAGDVVVRMESAVLQAQFASATAALDVARANRDLTYRRALKPLQPPRHSSNLHGQIWNWRKAAMTAPMRCATDRWYRKPG